MVASTIGLGPHEMTAWLWVFSAGLTVTLVLSVPLALYVAVHATGRQRQARSPRLYPYPVSVVRAEATRQMGPNHRKQSSQGG